MPTAKQEERDVSASDPCQFVEASLVRLLFLGPSHLSVGLQCADLIVSIAAAAERGSGQARGYLKKLLPRFATHPATGELDGVGIKRFPEVPPDRAPHKLF
jgi:hypothetical protein